MTNDSAKVVLCCQLRKANQRLLRIALGFLLLFAGCSDITPYYKSTETNPPPQPNLSTIRQRILLIGDAGEDKVDEPVLASLRLKAKEIPERTTILFLGDNIYENGMPVTPGPAQKEAKDRLDAQLEVARCSGAHAIFIPGNHDWKSNLEGLNAESVYVKGQLGILGEFLPDPGAHPYNPGPIKKELDGVRLIVLDTQYMLMNGCPPSAMKELTKLSSPTADREVMVVAHHPLATHGYHGGFYDFRDHLFTLTRWDEKDWLWIPTPVIGSLYPLISSSGMVKDNLSSKSYINVRDQIVNALKTHPPRIYAAGHDHSLQVLQETTGPSYILVSGLGSHRKATAVTHGDDTLFDHLNTGYMVVDYMKDRRVLLRVFEPDHEGPVYSQELTR